MSLRFLKPKRRHATNQPKAFNYRSLRITRSDVPETNFGNLLEVKCLRDPNRSIQNTEESKC